MAPQVEVTSPIRTTSQAIASVLRERIAAGELVSGQKLRQVELAETYGVSTTPVREALAQLSHEGLVRLHPQRGASVFVPNHEDLVEHYEIRTALEGLAIRKTAAAFSDADRVRAESILDEMEATVDAALFIELNHRFHMELYEVSGSERLCALIAGLRQTSNAYLQIYAARAADTAQINREHRAILQACVAQDADAAASAMERHLWHTVNEVSAELDER